MQFLRSLLFSIVMLTLTILIPIVALVVIPLPAKSRYAFIRYYAISNIHAIRLICGIRYEVIGRENIGTEPAIIMANHQSTFETLAVQAIFPSLCFVVKRELMWIPFFGWALSALRPIAINRKSGHNAVQQVVEQGTDRLKSGMCVMIFPEGTRTTFGKKGRYKKGGAILAQSSGYDITPIAHNAGKFWPKKGFIKIPGTVKVVIGEKIVSKDKSINEIATQLENWIETTKATLD